jgi:two-component system, NtrC family, response regulator HydG
MAAAHILCVDDDRDTCDTLSDILTDLGYGVGFANDGFVALEMVERNGFGLALLDYRMPGMDGLELYRRIRQLRAGILGILVTAFAQDESLTAAKEFGVRHILPKPVDFGRLIPLIEECVGQPG